MDSLAAPREVCEQTGSPVHPASRAPLLPRALESHIHARKHLVRRPWQRSHFRSHHRQLVDWHHVGSAVRSNGCRLHGLPGLFPGHFPGHAPPGRKADSGDCQRHSEQPVWTVRVYDTHFYPAGVGLSGVATAHEESWFGEYHFIIVIPCGLWPYSAVPQGIMEIMPNSATKLLGIQNQGLHAPHAHDSSSARPSTRNGHAHDVTRELAEEFEKPSTGRNK